MESAFIKVCTTSPSMPKGHFFLEMLLFFWVISKISSPSLTTRPFKGRKFDETPVEIDWLGEGR
ncbi:MAG: hypothetical protein DRP41_01730 [Thermodesulfobacteriota bacterium]|nr:MAG: hypothetical protein DRP41_01730 [Thermodesulfobacteriota bacterium]